MDGSPSQEALEAVLRPLRFAARDAYAGIDRVVDLETSVAEAAARGAEGAVPKELRKAFRTVRDRFRGSLQGAARQKAVERALASLAPFAEPDFAREALAQPPSVLPGLGPRRAEVLAKRGIRSVEDLLYRLPTAYDDRRQLASIADLQVGRHATFVARVLGSGFSGWRGRGGRGGRLFEAVVGDETGTVQLKWFRGTDTLEKAVAKGALLLVTGDVKRYRFSLELQHPEVEVLADDDEAVEEAVPRRIVPQYAAPEGIHPRALRRAVARAVADYADLVPGRLPRDFVRERELPSPSEALRELHLPSLEADAEALSDARSAAHERLILEELYLLELGLALRRDRQASAPGIPMEVRGARVSAAMRALPFSLTGAQRRVWQEIASDLARPHPMSRLLEGDVGSGKTVLAYLASVAVAESGFQTALMAPTELLAEQHHRTLCALAAESSLRVALLTASVTATHAEAVRAGLAAGEIDLVVGTHALLQEPVAFQRRGLVVVDEQHRFGVKQRAALRGSESQRPHTLVMTATPIPRTLAMTLHGDLDLSVLDELPPGRQPVKTSLLRTGEGREVVRAIREATSRGEQVYVVYPLVEESERLDLRAASESAERIAAAFPDLQVDLVHGRLDAASRSAAMGRFERGETHLLVSTTVIEVGVDVPNATLMVIEHAERFGLAQLHQLRGRVGRGRKPGSCLLVARGASEGSEARLAAMLETTDGFAIAEADLRIRGPGEFLGTRQHGRLPDLRIADLVRDRKWVSVARETARQSVQDDPGLARQRPLLAAVYSRWGEPLALSEVG